MATAPKKPSDHLFDFGRLNKWFAWSALALLGVTVGMVLHDYAKPWKRLQAEFRDLEREQLLQEAEEERRGLDENEIDQVREEIEREATSLEERRGEVRELERRLGKLEKKLYEVDSGARTVKSELDAVTYEYDRALQEGESKQADRFGAEVAELQAELRERRKVLEALGEERDGVRGSLEKERLGSSTAEARLDALRQGLNSLEQRAAGLDKKIDFFLLNAPLLDFVKPALKIEQVMLPGLFHDMNFTRVDRVDRCVTCHVAANRVGFEGEEWRQPFRSHPRLDLFVGASSPHPYGRFGCSSCHGGLDRSTDFARVGHSPSDAEEMERWVERWGWEPQPYLETPVHPVEYSEAGCVTCHAAEVWTPESRQQDVGRELMGRMGCFVCHKIDYPAFADLPRPGPNLAKVAGKVRPEWAYRWIEAPREFRPTTWMPHFFFQPNTATDANLKKQSAEINSAVAYLWEKSEVDDYPPAPPGDVESGRELFETVGCTGCHLLDPAARRDQFLPQINRLHGPNLVRTGSKVSSGWLYAWIKDPTQYAPDTRMPSLRLTDREAADITAYLMSSRDPKFENLSPPRVDEQIRDQLILEYLQNNLTIEQSEAALAEMSPDERDVYLGGETIQKYGCWGCHDLAGFELAKPIGVELTEEGSKPLHQFDFGHVHEVPHTRHDWMLNKLLEPRIWDRGKEAVKGYGELLKMPDFGMSEPEAEAVLTTLLGFTKESAEASHLAGREAGGGAVAEGRKLITRFNCQGCHLIEGEGHAIRSAIQDAGLLPPNLAAEGSRVQADWLFGYLHDPGQVRLRPWLTVRMPEFGFDDGEVNRLVAYFRAREGRDSFLSVPDRPTERDLAVGEIAFNMFQCAKCHPSGPQPKSTGVVGAGELAPSLLLAADRLRHDWVPSWIRDPQRWIPGTKMPANFTRSQSGEYASPLGNAIDTPMFVEQRRRLLRHFDSEAELKRHLADADYVTGVLRDHIWWSLESRN